MFNLTRYNCFFFFFGNFYSRLWQLVTAAKRFEPNKNKQFRDTNLHEQKNLLIRETGKQRNLTLSFTPNKLAPIQSGGLRNLNIHPRNL